MLSPPKDRRPLILWLGFVCLMIFLMCVIGAITRLTESGLSITEWQPVRGTLPPLSEAAWQDAFAKYQATPQYRAINAGMSLDAFKGIFFWEWLHRLWGRLIGLAYALPLAVFWLRRRVPPGFGKPLLIGLLLGGLQGFVGWFMVQSGLVDGRITVSHFRLALHLALALLIFSFLLWQAWRLFDAEEPGPSPPPLATRWGSLAALTLLATTMVWGAFTAGLDAGKIYTTWPLMGGQFLPGEAGALQPAWLNPLLNPAAVQFTHRWLAFATFITLLLQARRLSGARAIILRRLGIALGFGITAQFALGLTTLLTAAAIVSAALHQANAVFCLGLMVSIVYWRRRMAV